MSFALYQILNVIKLKGNFAYGKVISLESLLENELISFVKYVISI